MWAIDDTCPREWVADARVPLPAAISGKYDRRVTGAVMYSEMPPAEIIAGRYRIERRLGRGGMGSVWQAQHLSLDSPVAIKLIDRSLAASEEARARFLREAQSAAQLRSPHVVQILDHGIDHGVPYIAMELLEGESLAQRLERSQKLPRIDTVRIMVHIARAMARAHAANIVHRDLKPDNVFLVQNDDEEIAKVLDFGIARADDAAAEPSTRTRPGSVMGTPYYMSPEQVEGKTLDHRADLWSIAVMAFECSTGVRPFDGSTLGGVFLQICSKPIIVPSEVAPELPPAFDAWFERATRRDPNERFQTAKELADALRKALLGELEPNAQDLESSAMKLRISSTPEFAGTPGALAPISSVPGVARSRLPLMAAGGALLLLAAAWLLWPTSQPLPERAHIVTPAAPPAAEAPGQPQIAEEVLPLPEVVPAAALPAPAEAAPAKARAATKHTPAKAKAATRPRARSPQPSAARKSDQPAPKLDLGF